MPISADNLRKFPNEWFVETGSFHGDGIAAAVRAGFRNIISIELSPYFVKESMERFKGNPEITIIQGDSAKILLDTMDMMTTSPITFWLDAHFCNCGTAMGDTICPLVEELRQICCHRIKTHTILIDDVRLFGTKQFDWVTEREITDWLRFVNSDYAITHIDGLVKDDILVACV